MKTGSSSFAASSHQGAESGEQYVQSLLFARHTANTSPDSAGHPVAQPSTSSRKTTHDVRSTLQSTGSDMPLSPPPRARSRVPPRKSVLDERNGIFGSSAANGASLRSPAFTRESPFMLSPVDRVSTEPRVHHRVEWEGEDIDGDFGLLSSRKTAVSGAGTGYRYTEDRSAEGAVLGKSPGAFGRLDLAAHNDAVDIYGDARNPMSLTEVALQRWIVVFGFSSEPDAVERVLSLYQQYGDIDKYVAGGGNWLFIRYTSPLDAHGAEQDSGNCLLSSNQMLGVVRLSSADKAKKYRALLEEALGHDSLSSRGSSGRVGGRNPVRQSLGTPGRPAAGDGSRHEGQSDEAGSALRNRREALGSAAYRQHFSADLGGENEQRIMRAAPRRRKSICSRLYDFFFLY